MNKVLVFICSMYIFSEVAAKQNVVCSPELKPYVEKIQQLPEGSKLIDKIWEEGPVKIYNSSKNPIANQFGACWDSERRIIFVNANREKGQVYKSIIFELHNALVNSKMDYFDKMAINHKIGREEYIRAIENLEYINSKNGEKIANLGIARGLFPIDCKFNTYSNFEEHYRWQIHGGHSAVIGQNYDYLSGG